MKESKAKERLKRIAKKNNEYIKQNYDRVVVLAPTGTKDRLKDLLKDGESINALINGLIQEEIARREYAAGTTEDSPGRSADTQPEDGPTA